MQIREVIYRPPLNRVFVVLALVICAYGVSYLALSLNGRYEPAAIGLNGVKSYGWAPQGFVTDYRWSREMMITYLPLHYLDEKFWHTSDKAYTGKYPVDKVSKEDIYKVYRAWGAIK